MFSFFLKTYCMCKSSAICNEVGTQTSLFEKCDLFKSIKTQPVIYKLYHILHLCYSPGGKAVVVGHADGAIIKYNFEDEGQGDNNVSIKYSGALACC